MSIAASKPCKYIYAVIQSMPDSLSLLFSRLKHLSVEAGFNIVPVHTLIAVYSLIGIDASPSAEWL